MRPLEQPCEGLGAVDPHPNGDLFAPTVRFRRDRPTAFGRPGLLRLTESVGARSGAVVLRVARGEGLGCVVDAGDGVPGDRLRRSGEPGPPL